MSNDDDLVVSVESPTAIQQRDAAGTESDGATGTEEGPREPAVLNPRRRR